MAVSRPHIWLAHNHSRSSGVSYHPWDHAWIDTRPSRAFCHSVVRLFIWLDSSSRASSSRHPISLSVSETQALSQRLTGDHTHTHTLTHPHTRTTHTNVRAEYTINSLVLHNRFKPSNLILLFASFPRHRKNIICALLVTRRAGDANYPLSALSPMRISFADGNSFRPIILICYFFPLCVCFGVLLLISYMCGGACERSTNVRFNSNECRLSVISVIADRQQTHLPVFRVYIFTFKMT